MYARQPQTESKRSNDIYGTGTIVIACRCMAGQSVLGERLQRMYGLHVWSDTEIGKSRQCSCGPDIAILTPVQSVASGTEFRQRWTPVIGRPTQSPAQLLGQQNIRDVPTTHVGPFY